MKYDNIINALAILPFPIIFLSWLFYNVWKTGEWFKIDSISILTLLYFVFMIIIGVKELLKSIEEKKQ